MPREVREALQDAMEIAIANVPAIDGKVYVCPDVSGSMHSPVTGHRKGATTDGALHRRRGAGRGGGAAREPVGARCCRSSTTW